MGGESWERDEVCVWGGGHPIASIHIIDRGVAIVAVSNRAKSQECVCGAQLNEEFESPQHREGPSISVRARLTGRVFICGQRMKAFCFCTKRFILLV